VETEVMTVSNKPRLKYHRDAYRFIFEALQFTQEKLKRVSRGSAEEDAHISGQELMEGLKELALKKFGLLSKSVFHSWGVRATDDFGRMVFELIERGEMRKTDRDQLTDFFGVFDFDEALDNTYVIPTQDAFRPVAETAK
jgi:uncharacterized repeat protein (TIGR04138 family)